MAVSPVVKAVAETLREYLREREPEMLDLLRRVVEINSHTANKAGVDDVGKIFEQAMQEAGLNVVVQQQPEAGNHLLGRTAACGVHDRQVLLLGHLDTVFPPDMGFNAYSDEGDRIHGPGVYDMKGGLVIALYALKALAHAGLLDAIPVTFLMNSDEETGSQHSRGLIMAEANRSLYGLVFEGRGLKGELVTGRKGKATYKLTVHGQAGHVGAAGAGKASAILELARLILDLEALNDSAKGFQVNVGVVEGGSAPNAVPQKAMAMVDARFPNPAAGQELNGLILDRCDAVVTPGTSIEPMIVSGRPAMETDQGIRRLLEQAKEAGDMLGEEVLEEFRGGVSDANFLAAAGVPVLDGFGPRGGDDHSPDEYALKSSIVPGAALAGLTLWLCWERMRGA